MIVAVFTWLLVVPLSLGLPNGVIAFGSLTLPAVFYLPAWRHRHVLATAALPHLNSKV